MENSIENSIDDLDLKLDTRGAGHDEKSAKAIALITIRRVVAYTVLIILSILCLFSLYILIVNSSRSSGEISTSFSFWFGSSFGKNWMSATTGPFPVLRSFLNSFIIAALSGILCTYFSTITAYGIHMYNFKLKRVAFIFILLVMMVPTQVSAIGLYKLCVDIGLTNLNNFLVFTPLVIPSIASPIVFFYMKQYMESVLPTEMVEAARVDGAGEIRIFHRMVLPIMKPALAIQFIFSFVASWNNYFIPQLVLSNADPEYKTMPIIFAMLSDKSNTQTFDYGQLYMIMLLAVVPLLIVYLIFSKFILKNLTSGSVKG